MTSVGFDTRIDIGRRQNWYYLMISFIIDSLFHVLPVIGLNASSSVKRIDSLIA